MLALYFDNEPRVQERQRISVFVPNLSNNGLFQKKNKQVVEDMEFPGVSKKQHWNFQGLIKNEVEFLGVTKKKIMLNFQGSWILGLELKKKKNSRGVFKKVCPLPPLLSPIWFFSRIAQFQVAIQPFQQQRLCINLNPIQKRKSTPAF